MGTLLVAMLAASGPAWAFSDSTDSGSSSGTSRDDDDDERSSAADYRYSGNGFNFSMSRNVTQPNGAAATQDSGAEQTPPSRSRPGFFRRTMRSIFGGD